MEFIPAERSYLHIKLGPQASEKDIKTLGAISFYRDKLWNALTLVFEPRDIDSTLKGIQEQLPGVEILEAGLSPGTTPPSSIIRISPNIALSPGDGPLTGPASAIFLRSNLSFGTGHHPTTEFCIRLMEKAFSLGNPQLVFDLGTGSGVLALCAVKLGANKVIAVDVDPRACVEARENVKLNRMEGKVGLVCGSIESIKAERRFDLLLANLTIGTVKTLGSHFPKLVRESGLMIVSGFSEIHIPQVLQVIGPCRLHETLSREGWAALLVESREQQKEFP